MRTAAQRCGVGRSGGQRRWGHGPSVQMARAARASLCASSRAATRARTARVHARNAYRPLRWRRSRLGTPPRPPWLSAEWTSGRRRRERRSERSPWSGCRSQGCGPRSPSQPLSQPLAATLERAPERMPRALGSALGRSRRMCSWAERSLLRGTQPTCLYSEIFASWPLSAGRDLPHSWQARARHSAAAVEAASLAPCWCPSLRTSAVAFLNGTGGTVTLDPIATMPILQPCATWTGYKRQTSHAAYNLERVALYRCVPRRAGIQGASERERDITYIGLHLRCAADSCLQFASSRECGRPENPAFVFLCERRKIFFVK